MVDTVDKWVLPNDKIRQKLGPNHYKQHNCPNFIFVVNRYSIFAKARCNKCHKFIHDCYTHKC